MTPTGSTRYVLPRKATGHCDEAVALALCAHAAGPGLVKRVGKRAKSQDSRMSERELNHLFGTRRRMGLRGAGR